MPEFPLEFEKGLCGRPMLTAEVAFGDHWGWVVRQVPFVVDTGSNCTVFGKVQWIMLSIARHQELKDNPPTEEDVDTVGGRVKIMRGPKTIITISLPGARAKIGLDQVWFSPSLETSCILGMDALRAAKLSYEGPVCVAPSATIRPWGRIHYP